MRRPRAASRRRTTVGRSCSRSSTSNGFKQYNDTFGHPAGDALLARLGRSLAVVAALRGTRLPHGRRRVLRARSTADGTPADVLVRRRGAALTRAGRRLRRSALVRHRSAARTRRTTVRGAAPRRPADVRAEGRAAARPRGEQSSSVLLTALAERDPELGEHLHGVAELAEAVGAQARARRRGDRARAASPPTLHDVGKVAIPDAILHKPGPLDEDEWAFIRRHTLIGERILTAAPALRSRRAARPLEPRALRRHRLPRRAGRRGHPARLADHLRLRRLRRDDSRAAVRAAADRSATRSRSSALRAARSSTRSSSARSPSSSPRAGRWRRSCAARAMRRPRKARATRRR